MDIPSIQGKKLAQNLIYLTLAAGDVIHLSCLMME